MLNSRLWSIVVFVDIFHEKGSVKCHDFADMFFRRERCTVFVASSCSLYLYPDHVLVSTYSLSASRRRRPILSPELSCNLCTHLTLEQKKTRRVTQSMDTYAQDPSEGNGSHQVLKKEPNSNTEQTKAKHTYLRITTRVVFHSLLFLSVSCTVVTCLRSPAYGHHHPKTQVKDHTAISIHTDTSLNKLLTFQYHRSWNSVALNQYAKKPRMASEKWFHGDDSCAGPATYCETDSVQRCGNNARKHWKHNNIRWTSTGTPRRQNWTTVRCCAKNTQTPAQVRSSGVPTRWSDTRWRLTTMGNKTRNVKYTARKDTCWTARHESTRTKPWIRWKTHQWMMMHRKSLCSQLTT